jgi:chemotaxis protein methyltransferase CheR
MHHQSSTSTIHSDNYRLLQKHVYAYTGIVLEGDKHYLFESRLAPVVKKFGLNSVNELCALLAATRDRNVTRQVVEAMTTNETYFFRDPAHFEAIRTVLLPRLRAERDPRKIRSWSAAASTGQEAYSLAMLLLQEGFAANNTHILGTDVSSQVLERARAGRYQEIEVNRGLPASLLVKHFQRCGVDWQLSDAVRRMVQYETMDLRQRMCCQGPFNLVFCRNVLIYFDHATRRQVLHELHRTLFQGGWLLLGGSETGFGIDERFERQTIAGAIVHVAR